jgi:hypothetical protein
VLIKIDLEDDENEKKEVEDALGKYIIYELQHDGIAFENPLHQEIIEEYILQLSNNIMPNIDYFKNSGNVIVSSFVINNFIEIHELSKKWSTYGVEVSHEINHIKRAAQHVLFSLKEKILNKLILEKREELKVASTENQELILSEIIKYENFKKRVNKLLGRVVIK